MTRRELAMRLAAVVVLVTAVLTHYGEELFGGTASAWESFSAAMVVLASILMAGLFVSDYQIERSKEELIHHLDKRIIALQNRVLELDRALQDKLRYDE